MSTTNRRSSSQKPGALRVGHHTPLWRTRRGVRKALRRWHKLVSRTHIPRYHRQLHVYKTVDEFAASFFPDFDARMPKPEALRRVSDMIAQLGYSIVEADEHKPWGGMYRLDDTQSERFIKEFFPGLTLTDARLGRHDVRLSPKFLLVAPGKRLSWQYHHRRAERWHFLTAGAYARSMTDNETDVTVAPSGTVIQFGMNERHRLSASNLERYTLVAEIWQHTDPAHASDEADIVRLQDDFDRT